jgi:uncharacterized protein with NAD-binding domain and iron-sulfur cluster
MTKEHVIVLGGGVAGLSAAHELAERGIKVSVYEQRHRFGGKARSMPVPDTATPGHEPLPGEHGFRFVPGFYRHLPDTMSRIPYVRSDGKMSNVAANLVRATMFAYARDGEPDAKFPTRLPETLKQLLRFIRLVQKGDIGLTPGDVLLFGRKLLVLLTSCEARRMGEWESVAWWDFIEAAERSPVYQKYLGRGLTRSLVAMKAEVSSTRTVGYILLQLMLSMLKPGGNLDRLLDGPTNDVWIDPWTTYLKSLGVELHMGAQLERLNVVDGRIASVTVCEDGRRHDVVGDQFIVAVPVEKMQELLNEQLLAAAPSLGAIKNLRTDWMNGVQFYLDRDVPEVHGHVIYIDSPWSLTSVSQHQFWKHVDLAKYANGEVKGVLSVDISDWDAPGMLYGKAARDCTRQEIYDECLAQLKHHMKAHCRRGLERAKILYWHLDPDIVVNPPHTRNMEPLLVNTTGSWASRPSTGCAVPNLHLASDYVRTYTDLATMEGANEAARRAVNGVLVALKSEAKPCGVWPLQEPAIFLPMRWLDRGVWALGLRNIFDWPNRQGAAENPGAEAPAVATSDARVRVARLK